MSTGFHCDLGVSLDDHQRGLVLSIFPPGARIARSQFFDNYNLPCPIRVDVLRADGRAETVVLRSPRRGSAGEEAALLQALGRLGLPVPLVLAGPSLQPPRRAMLVLSMLPGTDVQKFSMASPECLQTSKRILLEGIARLSSLTGLLLEDPIGHAIPRRTLLDQFKSLADDASEWAAVPLFRSAMEILRRVLAPIDTPLVFTNGDYQPGNFLTDGQEVTGFVDFEGACFQDPLFGFAKYPIYDLHPLNTAGLVESMLKTWGFSKREFAPRLALGCLLTLRKEISVRAATVHDYLYKKHVLALLADSIHLINC